MKSQFSVHHAIPIAQEVARMLQPACEQLIIAGSLRRYASIPDKQIGDIEIVAVPRLFPEGDALIWLTNQLVTEGCIKKAEILIQSGKRQGQSTSRWGEKFRSFEYKGIQLDLFSVEIFNFGIQSQLKTGSRDFNVLLMTKLKSAPFKLDGFVAYWHDTPLHIPDEKAWFKLLGLPFISPNQRNENHLQEMFAKSWTGWGNPKDFLPKPKQLKLGGDFNMYDEGALIAHLEKQEKLKPLSSKSEQPIQWSKPWVHPDGKNVIVFNGWQDGERKYALASMDSPIARQHARTIMGCTYMSETDALYKWITKQNKKTIPVDHRVHCGYVMPEVYEVEFDKTTPVASVALDSLIYTMPDVYESWVWWYWRNQSIRDDNNHMIQVVRFTCGTHLLLDGHHRCEAAKQLHRTGVKAQVNSAPMTFAEATNPDARLAFLADVLDEAYSILEAAKEKEYA